MVSAAKADVPAARGAGPALVPPLVSELRGTRRAGLLIALLFFGAGGGWAATAPLSGAVIASGSVSPESSRQTVQHLEGGIVRDILVRNGDVVAAGQPLLILDDMPARTEAGRLSTRLRALAAAEARLLSEWHGLAEVRFDHPSLADRADPEVALLVEHELKQFAARQANDKGREAIFTQRIAQLEQQILGTSRQLAGVRRQMALIREEIAVVGELVAKGHERKPRLLALQREEANLLGSEGELAAQMARGEEGIGEARLQILQLRTERTEQAGSQLAETRERRLELEQDLESALDRLSRTALAAPRAGTVLDLRFSTAGGVIRPGEAVLDLVPVDDELVIDARIRPGDIDDVRPGLPVHVLFPSYPQRGLHRIDATLRQVSADVIEDPRTGERLYTARIEIDRAHLQERAPEIELTPGLPAEAYIATAQRTLLDYLLQPLRESIERSLRER